MRYLVTCSGCSASRLLRLCLSACDARQAAAPLHAYRKTPLLRVHCIDAATTPAVWCRGATLLIRLSIQLDYSDAPFTLTLTWAGPIPAAESAHNKTLQFPAILVFSCPKNNVYKAGFEPISAAKEMFVLQLSVPTVLLVSLNNDSGDSGFYRAPHDSARITAFGA